MDEYNAQLAREAEHRQWVEGRQAAQRQAFDDGARGFAEAANRINLVRHVIHNDSNGGWIVFDKRDTGAGIAWAVVVHPDGHWSRCESRSLPRNAWQKFLQQENYARAWFADCQSLHDIWSQAAEVRSLFVTRFREYERGEPGPRP